MKKLLEPPCSIALKHPANAPRSPWLPRSEFQATAQDVFMTLPPHTTRTGYAFPAALPGAVHTVDRKQSSFSAAAGLASASASYRRSQAAGDSETAGN